MGKAPKWSPEEDAALSKAWIQQSEDEGSPQVNGTNQTQEDFWTKVVERFKRPVDAPQGTYDERTIERGVSPLVVRFRETIARDVKKFNNALLKVFHARPSGVSEEEKVNMAIAIHLGKSDAPNYRHRDFERNDWKFYLCWETLKTHRSFLPPTPPPPVLNEVEEVGNTGEVGSENSSGVGESFVPHTPAAATNTRTRGGFGRSSTKKSN